MSEGKPILDYANLRNAVGQPLDSRIEVRETGEGVEFIDPPLGWKTVSGDAGALAIICLLSLLLVFRIFFHSEMRDALVVWMWILLLSAGVLCLLGYNIYLKMTRPKIIAVRGGKLVFYEPTLGRRTRTWTTQQIKRIEASGFDLDIRTHRSLGDLRVFLSWGRNCPLLRGRDKAEVIWLAMELSRRLGFSQPYYAGLEKLESKGVER